MDDLKKIFMLCNSITESEAMELKNDNDEYLANFKWDGERIISFKLCDEVLLINRRGKECSLHFPEVCEELKKMSGNFWIDGEIISRDDDFTKLQSRALTKTPSKIKALIKEIPVVYKVFDILKFGDLDVRNEKLHNRYNKLKELFLNFESEIVQLSEYGTIEEMWKLANDNDKEGIIVKDTNSRYESGRRTDSWRKLKRWLETDIIFTKYSENPSGIRVETDDGVVACQVQGVEQSNEVKNVLDKQGWVEICVQYLETFKRDDGKLSYRFPSYKSVVYDGKGQITAENQKNDALQSPINQNLVVVNTNVTPQNS